MEHQYRCCPSQWATVGLSVKVNGMYPSLPPIQSFLGLFADKHDFLDMIDTGQFRISGPNNTVELLFKNIAGAILMPEDSNYYSTGVDTYAYPCDTPPDKLPDFIIGKQALLLTMREMNHISVGRGDCDNIEGYGAIVCF